MTPAFLLPTRRIILIGWTPLPISPHPFLPSLPSTASCRLQGGMGASKASEARGAEVRVWGSWEVDPQAKQAELVAACWCVGAVRMNPLILLYISPPASCCPRLALQVADDWGGEGSSRADRLVEMYSSLRQERLAGRYGNASKSCTCVTGQLCPWACARLSYIDPRVVA